MCQVTAQQTDEVGADVAALQVDCIVLFPSSFFIGEI